MALGIQKLSDVMEGLVKIISICIISCVGLVGGAVISYLGASLLYVAIFGNGPVKDGYECGRGMLVGFGSIFGGGLLGACVAGYAAIKSYGSPPSPQTCGLYLTQPGEAIVSSAPNENS